MYRIYYFLFTFKKKRYFLQCKNRILLLFFNFKNLNFLFQNFKILISHSCCIRFLIIEYQIYEFNFSFFFKCIYRNRSGHSFLLIFKICQKQPGTGCKVALYCTWVCPKYFLSLEFNGVSMLLCYINVTS